MTFESSPRNCLICCEELEHDKKVLISLRVEDDHQNVQNQLTKFEECFQCFWELLKINGEKDESFDFVEGVLSDLRSAPLSSSREDDHNSCTWMLPCCRDCYGALENISRLQRSIDEMKENQMEFVRKLEDSLLSTNNSSQFTIDDSTWIQIRKTLMSEIKKRQHFHSGNCSKESNEFCGNINNSRFELTDAPIVDVKSDEALHSGSGEFDDDASLPFSNSESESNNFDDSEGAPTPAKRRRILRSSAISPLNAVASEPVQLARVVKPCYVVLRRLSPTTLSKVNPEIPKKKEPEDDNEDIIAQNPRPRKKVGTKPSNLFWKITEQLILYKYTLIEAPSGQTHLKCLEHDCNFEVITFDFQLLFESMKDHIDSAHFPTSSKSIMRCPHVECQIECKNGQAFRSHLASSHLLDTVFCEICWKPIKHNSDNYKIHKWSHKNGEEQAAGEVPRKIVYNATVRKTINQQYREGLKAPPQKLQKTKVPPPSRNNRKMKKPPRSEMKSKATLKTAQLCLQNDFLLQLRDDLLLYKYTLIKVTPQEGVQCLEPGCTSFSANGTDYVALEKLKTHVESCHITKDPNSYVHTSRQCPLCDNPKIFTTGPALRYHLYFSKLHPENFCYACQSCGKPFNHTRNMKTHVLSHQPPDDRYGFDQDYDPVQGHPTDFKYVCSKCGRRFRTHTNLWQHEPIHLPKNMRRQFPCPKCPAILMSKAAVRNHLESIHQPELKKIRNCPICDKEFNQRDKYKFKIHMRGHTNEFPYVCDICGKGFKARHQFRRHQKAFHSENGGYKCEFCERSYKYPENLRRHKVTAHKDEMGTITSKK